MSCALELQGLSFRWKRGDAFALSLPSLTLEAGASLFLHGPSGSGKSTLLNLLGGVLTPQSGSIRLLGQDLSALSARRRDAFRADHLGFIFQQFNLLPYLSALDNVLLVCRFSRLREQRAGNAKKTAQRLLAALDIDAAHACRKASELSVGQQQRVAAARALLGEPEIILADEPTSALDRRRQADFIDLLLSESRRVGSAVVFVSHDLSLAASFDHRRELTGRA